MRYRCICGNEWEGAFIGKCVKCGSSKIENVEEIVMKNEKIERWLLQIERASNGYILLGGDPESGIQVVSVIQDDEQDDLLSGENLLWEIMEYFNFQGSKHDEQRLKIIREKQSDGIPLPDNGKNWEG